MQGHIISTPGDALCAVSSGLCLQLTEDSGFVGSSSSEGCSITGVHIKGTMWQSLCTSLAFRYYSSVWPRTSSAQMGRMQISDCSSWMQVALAHTIGHVAATVSMSKVAVSFTHIIKSSEPAFSVLISRFLLGESFPLPVYLSLIPIIGGCALTAATELNFNVTGLVFIP